MGSVSTMRGKPAPKQAQTLNNVMGSILSSASKAKGGDGTYTSTAFNGGGGSGGGSGGVQTAAQNVQTAPQQYSYGGINMTQDEANQKYQADLAAWRAPTLTGTGTADQANANITAGATDNYAGSGHVGVPTTTWGANGMGAGGPGIPNIGVLPTAPTVVPRQQLAQQLFYGGYSKNSPGGR
jgi:hypothetical protein